MKNVRYSWVHRTALLCTVLLAANASAEEKVEDGLPPAELIAANCDLTGYKGEVQTFNPPVSVPDNNAAGVVVGPIVVPGDGTLIADVVIDLKMSHTWLGDVIAIVGYDEDCDGAVDVQSTIICRPGRAACVGGTGVGCSSNLVCANTYLFDDTATQSLPTTGCLSTTNIPGGCYRPTGLGAGPLAVFDNLRKGGCWYLLVSDNAGGDLGTICEWSVHILNQPPIANEPASWGHVKALFQ